MGDSNSERALKALAELIELPPDRRAGFLDNVCGADTELRTEIESLAKRAATPGEGLPPAILQGDIQAIGPYRILEKIGEGGMGVVYKAEQRAPVRRTVALKVIKPGMDSKEVVARFGAERQALALISHPNV